MEDQIFGELSVVIDIGVIDGIGVNDGFNVRASVVTSVGDGVSGAPKTACWDDDDGLGAVSSAPSRVTIIAMLAVAGPNSMAIPVVCS
jgi:hypothetical protein